MLGKSGAASPLSEGARTTRTTPSVVSGPVFDDDLGDERNPTGDPLPPEDRLWRHPSEVGASRRAGLAAASQRPPSPGRPMLAVAVVAGLTGAAVAVTALALTGSLSPRVIERPTVVTSQLASATTAPSPETARTLAAGAAAAVVQIYVAEGATKRAGSGVVLRSDGALLTSASLVQGVGEAKVVLADGSAHKGTVEASDPDAGLAVIRIDADGLTPLPRSDRDPRPGDAAVTVAAGAAPGDEPSVSSGVVSSLDRTVHGFGVDMWGLIQADSAVLPTADGGAVVGPDGPFGLSVHVSTEPMVSYSVPIGVAWTIGLDLLEHGRARVARLGVSSVDVEPNVAADLGIDGGAVLRGVDAGGPAAAAGLRKDDIVVQIGANAIRSMADLKGCMHVHRPGQAVDVVVLRDGERTTVAVTLGEKKTAA
jgi:S1-C subfamily serine protease